MTICIAAFAAKSKAIVLVSDKAVSYGLAQSDTDVRKILPIGGYNWRALIAGDPSFALKVIQKAKTLLLTVKGQDISLELMMKTIKEAYQETRKNEVRDTILQKFLITEELIVARPNSLLPLSGQIEGKLVKELVEFDVRCDLLVCGFDEKNKPHIFSVSNPGIVTVHDLAGNYAIGSGAQNAIERMLWDEVERKQDLPIVLYKVLSAKANAEIVQGVGFLWDAEVMIAGHKAERVPRKIRSLIDEVFNENDKSPFEDKKFPIGWEKKLQDFADSVLPKSISRKPKKR